MQVSRLRRRFAIAAGTATVVFAALFFAYCQRYAGPSDWEHYRKHAHIDEGDRDYLQREAYYRTYDTTPACGWPFEYADTGRGSRDIGSDYDFYCSSFRWPALIANVSVCTLLGVATGVFVNRLLSGASFSISALLFFVASCSVALVAINFSTYRIHWHPWSFGCPWKIGPYLLWQPTGQWSNEQVNQIDFAVHLTLRSICTVYLTCTLHVGISMATLSAPWVYRRFWTK